MSFCCYPHFGFDLTLQIYSILKIFAHFPKNLLVEWNLFLVDFIGRACGYGFPHISYICACLDQFYYSLNTWRILNIWLSIHGCHTISLLWVLNSGASLSSCSPLTLKSLINFWFFICPQTLWYIQCNLKTYTVLIWYTYIAIWLPWSVI